ncbi:VanW family protein [Gracilibacillus saliphilus]|uniref:VanW family protein n=1 Tax=Gracilibacillus saliphilus TaxID=543890 RepID=UPI0013D7CFC4|nr:VanW family protein [Gracilibacillus saliphilus]
MKMTYLTIFFLLFTQTSVSHDLVVTYKGEPIASINRTDLMIPYLDDPLIDDSKFSQFTKELGEKISQEPVDATIDNDGIIVPGQEGYTLHRQKFKELFYTNFLEKDAIRIEAPILKLHPRVDSELLADIRTQQIGQYITYFNANNEERSHNISLSAEAINNHVVFPGKTFSFNEVVGKRTKEKGYLPAPEIVKGELTEGIGGGICQVSSTLFNAVDRAGVEIIERYSHSRKVPYVPPGRDATVSWYGPDFTFKNNYNQPLLIRSKAIDGKVIINIYSSELVEYTPRKVPNASDQLPKEIKIFSN